MRVLKLLGALLLCVGLSAVWQNREWVLDAYRGEHVVSEATFDGLDLELDRDAVTASIHERHRRNLSVETAPPALAFEVPLASAVGPAPELGGGTASMWGAVRTAEPALVGLPADAEPPEELWPVAGAVVEIERVTSAGSAQTTVITDVGGVFELSGLQGGRFRVRAYLPGAATSGAAEVFFLEAGEAGRLEPVVSSAPAGPVLELRHGSGAEAGGSWTVAATVATRSVDAEGRIVRRPQPGAVVSLTLAPAAGPVTIEVEATGDQSGELDAAGSDDTTVSFETIEPGSAGILSEPAVAADAGGASRWLLSCDAPGAVTATVTTPGAVLTETLVGCGRPEPDPVPVP